MVQTTHLWEGAKQGLSRASAHTATLCRPRSTLAFYHGDRGAVTTSSIPKLGGFRCMIDTRMASMPIWAQGEDDHSGAPRDLIFQISNSTGTIRSALGRGTQHGRPGKISAPRSKAESSLCSGRYSVVGYFECGG